MQCWKCGDALQELPRRIPFKETCDHCNAWLHVCKNCKYYSPGKPNDCLVPGTEPIADREAFNLCEEFTPMGKGPTKTGSASDAEVRLFGGSSVDDSASSPKDKFNDLFGD